MPSPDANVCGIVCDGLPDVDGVRWAVESMPGWQSPAVSVGSVAPSGSHGLALSGSWYRERVVTVNGAAEATSYAAAWNAYQRISSVAPLEATSDLILYEPVPKYLRVALADIPRVAEPSPSHVVQWALTLTAEYPFKRALTPTTVSLPPGSASWTQGGNLPAEFEVELVTSGTVVLTVGGLALSTGTLPAGSTIRTTPGERGVFGPSGEDLNTSLVPGYQWPAVPVGAVTATQAGTAELVLTTYDTFA